MKEPIKATLGCGCELSFRAGVEGSPVTVIIERKAATCTISAHVGGLPLFDHREALRPSTRVPPTVQSDYEGEG